MELSRRISCFGYIVILLERGIGGHYTPEVIERNPAFNVKASGLAARVYGSSARE